LTLCEDLPFRWSGTFLSALQDLLDRSPPLSGSNAVAVTPDGGDSIEREIGLVVVETLP